jgi:two-component system C4-dicarboxylate transport sensor histidine kinase DctB
MVVGLIVVGLLAVIVWQAAIWGRKTALSDLSDKANAALTLQTAALESELERRRSVPFVLAYDADMLELARNPRDRAKLSDLNRKLAQICQSVDAAVIYLMDRNGTTLAASNWDSEASFVGHNFAFRLYFQKALSHGKGEFFALGSVSQRPGFYVARAVPASSDSPLGVLVMKIQFDEIERSWSRGSSHVLVTDEHSVIVLSGNAAWRFRTLGSLPESTADALRNSLQFGHADLKALPLQHLDAWGGIALVSVEGAEGDGGDSSAYLKVSAPVRGTSWLMHTLTPIEPVIGQRVTLVMVNAGLSAFVLIAITLLLWNRRASARSRVVEGLRIREDLENRVRDRTAQLTDSNRRLENEIEERERIETVLRKAQEKLLQAEKLAALGQMAAGISHEVNQPLTAIRSYADNALVLQKRGRESEVSENLISIASLTDRIGQIMQHLRAFARKASGKVEHVSAASAVAGSLSLMAHRLRRDRVTVLQELPPDDVLVWGEQIRIEQVLINLLQNAADATLHTAQPRVAIRVRKEDGTVHISVEDNGCGIAPEHLPNLFSAFFTTKTERTGLGLGLYISRGIVEEFGGKLSAITNRDGGSTFEFTLRAVHEAPAAPDYESDIHIS